MKIDYLTLFPEMFDGVLNHSILKRAQDKEIIDVNTINFRDYSINKHKDVVDILSTIIPFSSHSALKKTIVVMTIIYFPTTQRNMSNANHFRLWYLNIQIIISAKTSDCVSTKQLVAILKLNNLTSCSKDAYPCIQLNRGRGPSC